jgi:hypothetical protein
MAEGVYQQVLLITEDYLGPASGRFLDRQISFHLGKNPQELTEADVPKLAEWLKVAIEVLTASQQLVDEFDARIRQISEVAR